jgi:ubiquitin C-terminal hydrolase
VRASALAAQNRLAFSCRLSFCLKVRSPNPLHPTKFLSVIQCLAHAPSIAALFGSSELLESRINDHPKSLGSKGRVAKAFGLLMRSLWKEEEGAVAPTGLRRLVGMRNERFRGALQHDAQVRVIVYGRAELKWWHVYNT